MWGYTSYYELHCGILQFVNVTQSNLTHGSYTGNGDWLSYPSTLCSFHLLCCPQPGHFPLLLPFSTVLGSISFPFFNIYFTQHFYQQKPWLNARYYIIILTSLIAYYKHNDTVWRKVIVTKRRNSAPLRVWPFSHRLRLNPTGLYIGGWPADICSNASTGQLLGSAGAEDKSHRLTEWHKFNEEEEKLRCS